MDVQWQGIGERLRKAIDTWKVAPGNKRAFQAEMEVRLKGHGGQAGRTYASVLSYLRGASVPSLQWLSIAADVLDVPLPWLLFGGYWTEPEAVDRLGRALKAWGKQMATAIEVGVGAPVDVHARSAIFAFTADYAVAVGRGDTRPAPDLFRSVGASISAPIRALGGDPAAFPTDAFSHFVAVNVEALRFLITQSAGLDRPLRVSPHTESEEEA
jgi:hypothetical protein